MRSKEDKVRIIAGEYRGRKLFAPKGDATRPTTDRVRESMMSALASRLDGFEGAIVLDAFAGSGALGLEALSRGASSVRFYEQDAQALATLQRNIQVVGAQSSTRVLRADVLKTPPLRGKPAFTLVLLDPPYAYAAKDVLGMVARMREAGSLAEGGLVMYEHDAADSQQVDDAAREAGLSLASRKKYGDTVVDLFDMQRTD